MFPATLGRRGSLGFGGLNYSYTCRQKMESWDTSCESTVLQWILGVGKNRPLCCLEVELLFCVSNVLQPSALAHWAAVPRLVTKPGSTGAD